MSLAIAILLSAGCAAVAITAIGVLVSRNVYERLHFLAPAATIGVVAVTAAVVVRESLDQAGVKAIIAGIILLVMNPILTHATARAARVREHGRWEGDES